MNQGINEDLTRKVYYNLNCLLVKKTRLMPFRYCSLCEKHLTDCPGFRGLFINLTVLVLILLAFRFMQFPFIALEIGVIVIGLVILSGLIANQVTNEIMVSYHGLRKIHAENERLLQEITRINKDLELRIEERTQNLRSEKEKVETILQSIADGVFTLDQNLTVLSWSPAAEKISGWPAMEAVGKDCFEVLKITDPGGEVDLSLAEAARLGQVLSQGIPAEGGINSPLLLITRDLRHLPLAYHASPLKGNNGKAVGLVVVMRDVTERQKLDQMKAEFMSMLSHELRTPLTPITGFTNLILSGKLGEVPESHKSALKIMQKQSKHLSTLIDSLLDMTRVEFGRMSVEKKPVRFNTLLEEAIESMRPLARERGIHFEPELPPQLPTIMGDEEKLDRVVTNLLGNALKFTPKGGTVWIRARETTFKKEGTDYRGVETRISDNGIGIAPDQLARIFGKFYQVDSSYTRAAGGLGLGLAIVKEIIEVHGGRVWAESEGIGKGAKFIFTLPVE